MHILCQGYSLAFINLSPKVGTRSCPVCLTLVLPAAPTDGNPTSGHAHGLQEGPSLLL